MDLRGVLKKRTQVCHDRIDGLYSRLRLSRREDLAHFLLAHHMALKPMEEAIVRAGSWKDFPPDLSALAQKDLRALGVAVTSVTPLSVPAGANPAGMVYVIAGSHFGSAVLRTRWRKSDDPVVLKAGAYLSSDCMRRYWRAFSKKIGNDDSDASLLDDIVKGAVLAFGMFECAYHEAQAQLVSSMDR